MHTRGAVLTPALAVANGQSIKEMQSTYQNVRELTAKKQVSRVSTPALCLPQPLVVASRRAQPGCVRACSVCMLARPFPGQQSHSVQIIIPTVTLNLRLNVF